MVSEILSDDIIKIMLLLIVFSIPIFMLCTQTNAQIWNMGTQTYWLDYSNLVSEANPQPSPYPAAYFMNLFGEANPQPSPYPTKNLNTGRSNTLTNSFQTQMTSTRDPYTSGR